MKLTETRFTESDIIAHRPTMKIGLLATRNDAGLPHLTLISSLQANRPTQLVWGQFVEGTSKQFIRDHPNAGFLIMTMDKQLWRGKATFTHTAASGPEYERYNNTPMFRYNAYFGIHTVYFMDLVGHTGQQALPMGKVIFAAVQTMMARTLGGAQAKNVVMNAWTRQLFNGLSNLKYLAYVDDDGFPVIVPVIQAQARDAEHLIFSTGVYGDELHAIPAGSPVALFGMTLDMEDVLVRGAFEGIRRIGGLPCGALKVDWVYNSMPPNPQQIYPPVELAPVETF
ncbi:MAG: hypothetical protein JXB35_18245 [Anaerolineae bacterium]|nr:hypothetical protein [Anaerolineae bacterium]